MKGIILGCGSSAGVPNLYKQYGNCDPKNPKNNRCRTALLLEKEGFHLLFDTPPEIRLELKNAGFPPIHSLVFTHLHADHTAGINDLKAFADEKPLPVYLNATDENNFHRRFYYLISDDKEMDKYSHGFNLNPVYPMQEIKIGPFTLLPLLQKHGEGQSLGFRIDNFAYSTDLNAMQDDTFEALKGIDTWVLGCVSGKENNKHLYLAKALQWIDIIRPRRVYLTHMGTTMDYATLCKELPPHVRPGYDGMTFDV